MSPKSLNYWTSGVHKFKRQLGRGISPTPARLSAKRDFTDANGLHGFNIRAIRKNPRNPNIC